MLTLGLFEGVWSAMIGLLLLVGAVNENAPLHKIFGPIVAVVVGIAAYGVHAAGGMHAAADVAGLALFVILAFFVPLAVMRTGWKQMRAMNGSAGKRMTYRAESTRTSLERVSDDEPAARKIA